MKFQSLTFFVLSLLLLGQAEAQVVSSSGMHYDVNSNADSSVRLIWLEFEMVNGEEKVRLIKSATKKGRLKSELHISTQDGGEQDLVLVLENSEGQEILRRLSSSPLLRTVEVFDENGHGERIEIQESKRTVLIRIPFDRSQTHLRIEKLGEAARLQSPSQGRQLARIALDNSTP